MKYTEQESLKPYEGSKEWWKSVYVDNQEFVI